MRLSADFLQRIAALNLTAEQLQGVLSILAEVYSADDARRERERIRRSKYPRRSQHGPKDKDETVTGTVTVTTPGPSQGPSQDGPPSDSLKKERKIPEPSGSGETQAELERDLFKRGRQVCGKNAGGLVSQLLKAKQFDVAMARSVIEFAATKHDPREFVAAAIRGSGQANGHGRRQNLSDLAHELADEARELERQAGISRPDDPFGSH